MAPEIPEPFVVIPSRSSILIEARSNVGPIDFAIPDLTGSVRAEFADGAVDLTAPPGAELELPLQAITSGNSLYDAELARRIDVRRYPTARLELSGVEPIGTNGRYRVTGRLALHGLTREVAGSVTVALVDEEKLVVDGEQSFDVRDFAIPSPSMLMLRIFPDVRVRLHLEAGRNR